MCRSLGRNLGQRHPQRQRQQATRVTEFRDQGRAGVAILVSAIPAPCETSLSSRWGRDKPRFLYSLPEEQCWGKIEQCADFRFGLTDRNGAKEDCRDVVYCLSKCVATRWTMVLGASCLSMVVPEIVSAKSQQGLCRRSAKLSQSIQSNPIHCTAAEPPDMLRAGRKYASTRGETPP